MVAFYHSGMNDPRARDERTIGRRTFLGVAGAGIVGAVAGCTQPSSEAAERSDTISSSTNNPATSDNSSIYEQVYAETIDSVPLVRALGVDNPFTDGDTRGQGSGFLYDETRIVTNEHVVYGSEEIDLQYINGDWTGATLLGKDYYSDLAVLEVDHVPESATPLGLSEREPRVGQEVLAIGNPLGLEGSMSQGIISGVNRSITPEWRRYAYPNIVQTDAGLNPGNSGGPLVDLEGDVVGVVHAGQGENIGFAISAALTERVVPALIEDGEYRHSRLGISLVTVDRIVANENDLDEATGVMVVEIVDEGSEDDEDDQPSPAEGILEGAEDTVIRSGEPIPIGGDVIREIDGEPIPDRHALSRVLALETSPGQTVTIEILRDGSPMTVELTLGERPPVN